MDSNICNDIQFILNSNPNRKYYVYRLVDPRNYHTFYVGKGSGCRVLQHVKDVKKLISNGENPITLKQQTIADIISEGKEVICIIHRWGLTEQESFEVEAALIDAYPGLTNINSGYYKGRGMISTIDLWNICKTSDYTEPLEDYVIVKTDPAVVRATSLYDAAKEAWAANLRHAKKYKYVLAVVDGIVREVYKVTEWYQHSPGRIAFNGHPTTDPISSVKNHRIPPIYRQKGMAAPFLYKK